MWARPHPSGGNVDGGSQHLAVRSNAHALISSAGSVLLPLAWDWLRSPGRPFGISPEVGAVALGGGFVALWLPLDCDRAGMRWRYVDASETCF